MKLCAVDRSTIASWKSTSMLNFNQRVAQKMITLQIKVKSQLFKAKNDHQVATGGKHGVLSCPQAAGRNAASTMLLHALGCYEVSTLVLTQPMVPTKTIFHTFASFLRTPFHPLQNLKSKETTKKITQKKEKTPCYSTNLPQLKN